MCNCTIRPNVNGNPGYRWNSEQPSIRPVDPPDLESGDELLYDGPGRCGGGSDSHSHHFCLVKGRHNDLCLLVRHGGGDERFTIVKSYANSRKDGFLLAFNALDDHGKYWFLQSYYHTLSDVRRSALEKNDRQWREAAAEKRIKVRKVRGQAAYRVSVDPKIVPMKEDSNFAAFHIGK